jgi:gamma-glutamyl-gamma-aminobutyrate hydrolase PuuD
MRGRHRFYDFSLFPKTTPLGTLSIDNSVNILLKERAFPMVTSEKKMLIGLTGPSAFTENCFQLIEEEVGANFVLLYQNKAENLDDWLNLCNGIVLAGGVDIHPTCYGESVLGNQNMNKFDLTRDVKEMCILDHCFTTKKPLLAICRGHQLLGIYKGLGNDFIMDLTGTEVCHHPQRVNISLSKNEPCHKIKLSGGAFNIESYKEKERKILKKLINDDAIRDTGWVNSFHHQALRYRKNQDYKKIEIIATSLTGSSQKDEVVIIEGMMGKGDENHWISVQWHPEYDYSENSYSGWVVDYFKYLLKRTNGK